MSFGKRSLVAVACLGLMTAGLLAACGGGDSDAEPPARGDTPAAGASATPGGAGVPTSGTGGSGATPAPPGFPAADEPPATTASANGQSVETGLGTYCWTLMCVDKIGVPTRGTLTVAAGDTVSVAVPPGAPALREAAANSFAAVTPQPLDDGSEIWPYPGAPGDDLAHTVAGDNVEVTVDLPPGRYVLAVSMFFETGDVVYGVLLEVR
jgi:hypothetical protein